MDPENVQDNADCELELPVEHPDFVVKNPDNLDFNQGEVSLPSLYKKIDLYSDGQIESLSLFGQRATCSFRYWCELF